MKQLKLVFVLIFGVVCFFISSCKHDSGESISTYGAEYISGTPIGEDM